MKAMVLAAGLGERLLPLTLNLPKAAISILGRPLITQILRDLASHGIGRAVINLHRHGGVLERLLADAERLPAIDFIHENPILGTAGGLRNAQPLLRGSHTILVRNSDFLADIDIAAALEHHRRSGRDVTLVVAAPRPGYATVDVDSAGNVISLGGQPPVDPVRVAASYLFTGCHVVEEEVLERIPAHGPSHIVSDVYREMAREGSLGTYLHEGFWWEFGAPEMFLEGCLRLIGMPDAERARILVHDPVVEVGDAAVAVGAGAIWAESVELRGHCALGADSEMAKNSRLEDAVIFPRCSIGVGARLRRVIIGPGVQIPDGCTIEEAVVCADPTPSRALPPTVQRRDGLLWRRWTAS